MSTSDDKRWPRVGVGAVVWRGEQVLLIRRSKPPRQGQWSLPGGKQEFGETIEEALHREVKEETDIDISVGMLIDVVDGIARGNDNGVVEHYTLIDISADWVAGEAIAGSDALEARWFGQNEIGTLGLWDETIRIIEKSWQQRND